MTSIPIITQGAPWPVTVFVKTKDTGVPLPLNGTLEVTLTKNGAATPFVTATLGSGIVSVNAAGGSLVLAISAASLASSGEGFGSMRIRRTDGTADIYVNYPVQFTINGPYPTDNDGTVVVPVRELVVTIASTVSPAVPPGSVSNGFLAQMPAGTVKANVSGVSSTPSDVGLTTLRTAMGAEVAGAGTAAVSSHESNPIAHPQFYHVRKRFKDFGLVGGNDDSATMQSAFDYIRANPDTPFDAEGSHRIATGLVLGGTSAATANQDIDLGGHLVLRPTTAMVSAIRRQFIYQGSSCGFTIDAGSNGNVTAIGSQFVNYADKYVSYGVYDYGVRFLKTDGINATSLKCAAYIDDSISLGGTVNNLKHHGLINAVYCGSGTQGAGVAAYNLQTTVSNRLDDGFIGAGQKTTFDVTVLPPSEIYFPGTTTIWCAFSGDGFAEKYEVVQLIGLVSGTKKVVVMPAPPTSVTSQTLRYYFGGGAYEVGLDSNINDMYASAIGSGLAYVGAQAYGSTVRIHAASVGIGFAVGSARLVGTEGTVIEASYAENDIDTAAYFVSSAAHTVNNGSINWSRHANPESLLTSSRYRNVSGVGARQNILETRSDPLRGWDMKWHGQRLSQINWPNNRHDEEASIEGSVVWRLDSQNQMPQIVRDTSAANSPFIVIEGPSAFTNGVFGVDSSALHVIGSVPPHYAPKKITFKPPLGWKINGGAVNQNYVVEGLDGPKTFFSRVDYANSAFILTFENMAYSSAAMASMALSEVPVKLLGRKAIVANFTVGAAGVIDNGAVTAGGAIERLAGLIVTNSGGRAISNKKKLNYFAPDTPRYSHDFDGTPLGVLIEPAATYENKYSQPTIAQVDSAVAVTDAAAPAGWAGSWTFFGDNSATRVRRNNYSFVNGVAVYLQLLIKMSDGDAPVAADFVLSSGGFAILNPDTGAAGIKISGPLIGGVYLVQAYAVPTFNVASFIGLVKQTSDSARTFLMGHWNYGLGRYPPSLFDNVTNAVNNRNADVVKIPVTGFTADSQTLCGEFVYSNAMAIGAVVAQAYAGASGHLRAFISTANTLQLAYVDGASVIGPQVAGLVHNTRYKFAVAMDTTTGRVRAKVTGIAAPADATTLPATIATVPTYLVIGSNNGASEFANTTIAQVGLVDRAWTASEIASWVG
jgi:hypothetical protein